MSRLSTLITLDTQEAVKRLLTQIPKLRQMAEDGDIDAMLLLIEFDELWRDSRLTTREAQVVEMRYIDGYMEKAVAAELGISQTRISLVAKNGITRIIGECQRRLAKGDATFAAYGNYGKDVD